MIFLALFASVSYLKEMNREFAQKLHLVLPEYAPLLLSSHRSSRSTIQLIRARNTRAFDPLSNDEIWWLLCATTKSSDSFSTNITFVNLTNINANRPSVLQLVAIERKIPHYRFPKYWHSIFSEEVIPFGDDWFRILTEHYSNRELLAAK